MSNHVRRSADPRLPLWLRVVWAGLERAAAGPGIEPVIVPWLPGELRATVDRSGLTAPKDISRAIATAKRYGLLDPGSCARVLVMPADYARRQT